MNYSPQKDDPELLDQLCQAIATQEVPALVSEPMMPWEQNENLRIATANTSHIGKAAPQKVLARMSSWRGAGLTVSVVAAAFLVGVFVTSGFLTSNSVFAQVQEAASKIRSIRFRSLEFEGDRDPRVTSVVIVSGVGERSEYPDGVEVISDYKIGRKLTLNHRTKTAEVVQLFDSPASLDQLWGRFLRLPAEQVKKLVPGTIDGKSVNRFEVQENGSLIVSVDPSTNLPVRMEMELKNGEKGVYRHVATDFVFNSVVDPSMLSTTPPSEYQLAETKRPASRKQFAESDLIVSPETGIGGAALGSSKEAIIAKLGEPDSIRESHVPAPTAERDLVNPEGSSKTEVAGTHNVTLQYPSDGFDLTIGSQGLHSIHCYGPQARGAMAKAFVGKTAAGIKLGATKEEVIAKYGKPEMQSSRNDAEQIDYFHKGYRFSFREEKLSSITVSSPWPESIKIEVIDKGNGKREIRVLDDEK